MAVDGFARALGLAAATAKDLDELKEEVAKDYATKEELAAAIAEALGSIQADLDAAKADLAELTNLGEEEGE